MTALPCTLPHSPTASGQNSLAMAERVSTGRTGPVARLYGPRARARLHGPRARPWTGPRARPWTGPRARARLHGPRARSWTALPLLQALQRRADRASRRRFCATEFLCRGRICLKVANMGLPRFQDEILPSRRLRHAERRQMPSRSPSTRKIAGAANNPATRAKFFSRRAPTLPPGRSEGPVRGARGREATSILKIFVLTGFSLFSP